MRVFVDSNVLFSASYKAPNRFEPIWTVPGVTVLTSTYCVEEVSRHLHQPAQRARLWGLLARSELVMQHDHVLRPKHILLPEKDWPVLLGSLAGHADVLVTGDETHFGSYFQHPIGDLIVELPKSFRQRYPEHFRTEGARS